MLKLTMQHIFGARNYTVSKTDPQSPPWGGVSYQDPSTLSSPTPKVPHPKDPKKYSDTYPLSALRPVGGQQLYTYFRRITPHVVLYLPRNVDLDEVSNLAKEGEKPATVHIEELWLDHRLKTLAAYFDM